MADYPDINFYASSALTEQNKALSKWGKAHNLLRPTIWLFEIFRIRDLEIESFHVILDFFRKKDVLSLLGSWNDCTYAEELLRFGLNANELLETGLFTKPLSLSKSLSDKPKTNYFALLFLLGNADSEYDELRDNLYLLKTWFFVKAIEAIALKSITHEKSIYELCRFFSFDNSETKTKRMGLCHKALDRLSRRGNIYELDFENFSSQIREVFVSGYDIDCFEGRENKATYFQRLYAKDFESINSVLSDENRLLENLEPLSTKKLVSLYSEPQTEELNVIDESRETAATASNPKEKPEYQTLSSRVILYTSAEQANYLPWSHFKLSPSETETLNKWLTQRRFRDSVDQLGQTLIYLCTVLGRVPVRIEDIALTDHISEEWTVSPADRLLRRVSPKNKLKYDVPSITKLTVLIPEPYQVIELPRFLSKGIELLVKGGPGKLIGDVWRDLSGMTLDSWFRKAINNVDGLSRVRGSMLQYCAEQRVFDQSQSNALSRILSYHPSQKLPSLVSYNTWTGGDILNIDLGYLPKGICDQSLVFGSQQNLDDDFVSAKFQGAYERLTGYQSSLVDYHNEYCLYCVSSLAAATGARPVRDPFENLGHFNLDKGFIYINDKSDGFRRDGRLCVLPKDAVGFVENYLDHLKKIVRITKKDLPSFSSAITHLLEPDRQKNIPLFFLLDSTFRIKPVKPKHFSSDGALKWDMPDNFFRHRFFKSMLKEGCHEEIIEGMTGHADLGISSFGQSSSRCFHNDLEKVRPIANKVFLDLGVKLAISEVEKYADSIGHRGDCNDWMPGIYGIEARKRARVKSHKKAKRNASVCIDSYLKDNEVEKLSQLSQEQFTKLEALLLNAEAGQPHPQCGIRFRYLTERCLREGPRASHYLRLTQRIDSFPSEPSCFDSSASADVNFYELIMGRLNSSLKLHEPKLVHVSEHNFGNCHNLFLFLLIIETRITSSHLIQKAMTLRGLRLVVLFGRYYIEFLDDGSESSFGASVQRHKISNLCAKYLDRVLGSKVKYKERAIPEVLTQLATSIRCLDQVDRNTFFDRLTRIVRHYNYYSLPGILAASLDGTPHPTSLPWAEWVRVQHRRSVVPKENPKLPPDLPQFSHMNSSTKISPDQMTENAFALADDFRVVLSSYRKSDVKKTVTELRRAFEGRKHFISSSSSLLFLWITHICEEGKLNSKSRKRSPYAKRSLMTPLSLLGRPLINLFGAHELSMLDKDEFNEKLADAVESREGKPRSQWQFLLYLRKLLLWASSSQNIPEIQWELLSQELGDYRHVSSGLVFEDEYIETLEILFHGDYKYRIQACVIVILGYRFGLRFSEAAWSRRHDLFLDGPVIYVVVKDYIERELKRTMSNRVVPLVFELNELEKRILDAAKINFDSHDKLRKSLPFLFLDKPASEIQSELLKIALYIKSALFESTQRPYITEHHLRHTFDNKLVLAFYDVIRDKNTSLGSLSEKLVRSILLGDCNYRGVRDSRSIARAMGHASVKQGFKSYCHIMTIWSDSLISDYRSNADTPLSTAIDVLSRLRKKESRKSSSKKALDANDTLKRTFQALSMASLGKDLSQAAHSLELDSGLVTSLVVAFTKIAGKRFPDSPKPFKTLLSRIKADGWSRLIEFAETTSFEALAGNTICPFELPKLVSERGHLFARNEDEVEELTSWLNILGVKGADLKIYLGKEGSETLIGKLGGFSDSVTDNIRKDSFAYLNESDGVHQVPSVYLGFVLQRNGGLIRNSFSLLITLTVLSVVVRHERTRQT